MPLDREETLRKADKLLRQGRLDLAIVEYRSVIEAEPSDWNTANTLGDLYFRSGQTDKAVAEYGRIADHLAADGFIPKAVALYRKILKIKPDEERAMWQLGLMSAGQGLLVEARANFLALAERRRARGDRTGEAEVRARLGDLDGADVETRLRGARARVEIGQAAAAVEQFKQIAADLHENNRTSDALSILREAATVAPEDAELRRSLMNAYAAGGDLEAAQQYAATAAELKQVADDLFSRGRNDEALAVLLTAAETDPTDMEVRAWIAKTHIARGDVQSARQVLTAEVAGSDPDLLWALAEIALRDGRIAEGTAVLKQIIAANPQRRDSLVVLGCSVGEVNPDAGYECVEVAARAAIAEDEWASAAAALNEFVHRVPHHIPALMHLVEVCVDGGLEATMHSAQAQLADAYLESGAGLEARMIAEDLVAREPWERANIERFRRALVLLGESDVDTIVADRLSGQSPFTSIDIGWPAPEPQEPEPPLSMPKQQEGAGPVIDFTEVLEEPAGYSVDDSPGRGPALEPAEIDLSAALHDMRKVGAGRAEAPQSIESVLKSVRDEVIHGAESPEVAEQHFKLATAYIEMSLMDDAMTALEVSAQSLRHRFRAGALLAKLYLDRNDTAHAVEWFERAAEAPAPSPAAAHQLLYELATVLEAQGEGARALAVLLELRSEAGEYRDVAQRLQHLQGS